MMISHLSCARSTRETTPCNLIRDPDNISTPGSSTKRAYSTNTNYRIQNSPPRPVPSTVEMDEFFTEPEKQQQQLFIEKYTYKPILTQYDYILFWSQIGCLFLPYYCAGTTLTLWTTSRSPGVMNGWK